MPCGGGLKGRRPPLSSNIGLRLEEGIWPRFIRVQFNRIQVLLTLPKIGRNAMTPLVRRTGMVLLVCVVGGASAIAQGWQHIGKVERVATLKEGLQDGVELTAGQAKVRVTQFYNGVIRVRVA